MLDLQFDWSPRLGMEFLGELLGREIVDALAVKSSYPVSRLDSGLRCWRVLPDRHDSECARDILSELNSNCHILVRVGTEAGVWLQIEQPVSEVNVTSNWRNKSDPKIP
jgi:hypothetical protein